MKYQNPILPGFHPDPSICRVGEDFYLVTSTFEFFPGVPIYHSKNLVNWELINYCLTSDDQLPLQGVRPSGGIYAPTLRYHNGTFFMTTTNVDAGGIFIVHTDDIRGKWSAPAWVKQRGIDPSLFWDDDGTCYFTSNGSAGNDGSGIFLCEINPFTGEMLSQSVRISYGCGGRCAEAPHIYKRDGWYYLMLAEGGTEYGHMETMQRARSIYGPYEACPYNPILTHRDTTVNAIQATGHADIVEDRSGNWWLVCLAIRPIPRAKLHHLGRETFLSPLSWDADGWPMVGTEGMLYLENDAPLPGDEPMPVSLNFCDDFEGNAFDLHWNFVRNPRRECYHLANGSVTLIGDGDTLSTEKGQPTMLAYRQQDFCMEAVADMRGDMQIGQHSGITAFYTSEYHYDIFLTREEEGYYVCLRKRVADIEVVVSKAHVEYRGVLRLKIISDALWYRFYYEADGCFVELGCGKTALLCTEATHPTTFTGVYWGLFSEYGTISFDRFSVKEVKND